MLRTLVLAAALGSLAAALSAQPAAAPPPATGDEIVVEVPRTLATPKPPKRANRFRGETELVARVRVGVFYNDLNLADPKDAARLHERLENNTRQACAYLDALYPLQKDPECQPRALAETRSAFEAAVAKAQARAAPATP